VPGIDAGFEWNDAALDAYFDHIVDGWPSHRKAILDAMGEDLAGGLRREIPTSSGAAKATIRTEDTDTPGSARVVAGGKRGVDYIEPLLHGSDPHAPGPPSREANPSLARWARRNDYPGGFESIYWSIYHYGTESHDFVSGPVDETQDRAGTIAERVLERRQVFR
jgi:hypothetical protein